MKKLFKFIVFSYLAFYVTYWFAIILNYYFGFEFLNPDIQYSHFTHTYAIICLIGLFYGVKAGEVWGGKTSLMGKSLLLFSVGLLMQQLGQISIAIYELVLDVHNPYPSFAEIFFFGSIPVYIGAIYLLGKTYGLDKYLSIKNKSFILVLLLGFFLTAIAYAKFLVSTEISPDEFASFFSDNDPIYVFLEILYPIGQSLYIAIAILNLILLKNIQRSYVYKGTLIILLALYFQFAADTVYLLYDEIFSDILYIASYTMITVSLFYFSNFSLKPKNGPSTTN